MTVVVGGSHPVTATAAPTPSSATELSPILTADGSPATTDLRVFPVVDATLFISPGPPSLRLGKLAGDVITWDAPSLDGLPDMQSASAIVGRYPDLLWMRLDWGPQEYYRYSPAAGSWSIDPTLQGGRRTSTEILPWRAGTLLAVVTDPESTLGEPAKTALLTLPGGAAPALPPLPRAGVGWSSTTSTGELVVAYSVPAEIAVLSRNGISRFPVPNGANCWVTGLVVRSPTESYVTLSDCAATMLRFDGAGFASMDLPTAAPIGDVVAMMDGTLWLADAPGALYRRPPGGQWAPVSSRWLTEPVVALEVSKDGRRLWVALGPEASGSPGFLLGAAPWRRRVSPEKSRVCRFGVT